MRVLTVTSLFPSRAAPSHGVFVLRRVEALRAAGAKVSVVAPVPWVPPGPLPSRYARLRAIPRAEEIGGIPVRHPRYAMVPKVGMYLQDRAYACGISAAVREEVERSAPDLIDVHYLYPDACAVARVARDVGVPFIASARGSDVKRLGRIPVIARRIRAALAGARGVVAVSRDLAATIRELGLHDGDVRVIPNGVDPTRFHPRDRAAARRALGLPAQGCRVVCVAHVSEVSGQALLLEALAHPEAPRDVVLDLVGGGPQASLRSLAAKLGVAGRVRFAGAVAPEEVPNWFAAADGSAHPGAWAGSPNAVLESLACGTPCLGGDLPEMREAISTPADGLLVPRTAAGFARGLSALVALGTRPSRTARTWADVGREVLAYFQERCGSVPLASR